MRLHRAIRVVCPHTQLFICIYSVPIDWVYFPVYLCVNFIIAIEIQFFSCAVMQIKITVDTMNEWMNVECLGLSVVITFQLL